MGQVHQVWNTFISPPPGQPKGAAPHAPLLSSTEKVDGETFYDENFNVLWIGHQKTLLKTPPKFIVMLKVRHGRLRNFLD